MGKELLEKEMLGAFYETLLCSPGMNEAVKIDHKISRKMVLLLSSIIEAKTTSGGESTNELLSLVPAGELEELKAFAEECLKKAGLKEVSEKLKELFKK